MDESTKYRRRKRNAAIDKLGGKCVRCGFSDRRALVFDHVNGDGFASKEKTSTHRAREVLKDKTGRFQLLCANCNMIKAHENKEWRTGLERSTKELPGEEKANLLQRAIDSLQEVVQEA